MPTMGQINKELQKLLPRDSTNKLIFDMFIQEVIYFIRVCVRYIFVSFIIYFGYVVSKFLYNELVIFEMFYSY